MTADETSPATRHADWESLRLLNSFRLFVAIVLMTGFMAAPGALAFGQSSPRTFLVATGLYALLGLLFAEGLRRRRPGYMTQSYLHFYSDVILLGVVVHASGGVASGLGILMVVPVAAAGTLLQTRYSLLYAALATLLLLTSEIIRHLEAGSGAASYTPAALLGLAMFASALLAGVYARRHAQSVELARQRSLELKRLERLNERIIQQMEAGILVVAPDDRITLANASARVLLGQAGEVVGKPLSEFSRRLNDAVATHRMTGKAPLGSLTIGTEGKQRVHVQFTQLGDQGTLIVLEDAAFIEEQVQQMKLASLGRLTAGIAHEVRNPLGAIAHSAQLLAESDLDRNDARMVEIQIEHCRRINAIIEGILQVSRRGKVFQEDIELRSWVQEFVTDFEAHRELLAEPVRVSCDSDMIRCRFQPEQLRQILFNLCDNCLQHGRTDEDTAVTITIRLARDGDGTPVLDVVDNGRPIPQETLDDLFEPFYTTNHTGTGLGLYLARELCELNDSNLQYLRTEDGNCMRITLPPAPTE
ncbi:MAG: ATP-binding protein [Halofilum sp. (in: g-proteobacteria)]|nr:ATP-binding protein [Halofilum sp. (in: g-proteobacteria)]